MFRPSEILRLLKNKEIKSLNSIKKEQFKIIMFLLLASKTDLTCSTCFFFPDYLEFASPEVHLKYVFNKNYGNNIGNLTLVCNKCSKNKKPLKLKYQYYVNKKDYNNLKKFFFHKVLNNDSPCIPRWNKFQTYEMKKLIKEFISFLY